MSEPAEGKFRHNLMFCRFCRAQIDVASDTQADGLPPAPPVTGDVSVCEQCGELSFYQVTGDLVVTLVPLDGDAREQLREQFPVHVEIVELARERYLARMFDETATGRPVRGKEQ